MLMELTQHAPFVREFGCDADNQPRADAVALVKEHLAAAGTSIDILLAEALNLGVIERIDHLAKLLSPRAAATPTPACARSIDAGASSPELEERQRKLLERLAKRDKA